MISLLKGKSPDNKSNASFFWINRVNASGKGFTSSPSSFTNPLGATTSSSCPRLPPSPDADNASPPSCPAKVVKKSGKVYWCYFDCYKEFVNAICEIDIIKSNNSTAAASINKKKEDEEEATNRAQDPIQDVRKTTTTRKRDISTKAAKITTSGSPFPLLSPSTTRRPLTSIQFLPSSSDPPSATTSSASSFDLTATPLDTQATAAEPAAIMLLDCDIGWKLFDDKCYKGIQMDTNGNEARNLCQFRDSAHLSSITSPGLQQAMQSLVSNAREAFNRPLLIDGRYDRRERTFRWSETNQPFRYTNWATGQPDLQHDCVAIVTNRSSDSFAAWITIDCNQDANLLCR